MTENITEARNWRIRLKGDEDDLADLATIKLTGSFSIVCNQGQYFLESQSFDGLDNPTEVARKAAAFIRVLSNVARVRKTSAQPISLQAVWWKTGDNNWRQVTTFEVNIKVYPNTVRLNDPSLFTNCVELAVRDKSVATTLDDFQGEWDFPKLRRVGEAVLLDLGSGDVKNGIRELVNRRWASQRDCTRFQRTANFGDSNAYGAHSRLRRNFFGDSMNVIEAGEFLANILARWMEAKITKAIG